MRLYFGRNMKRRICGSVDGAKDPISVELSLHEAEHLRDTLDELLDDHEANRFAYAEDADTEHDAAADLAAWERRDVSATELATLYPDGPLANDNHPENADFGELPTDLWPKEKS